MKKTYIITLILLVIIGIIGFFIKNKLYNKTKLIYIVYAGEKGDKSYTDGFYEGVFQAQKDMNFRKKEFNLLNTKPLNECFLKNNCEYGKPDLVIIISDSQRQLVKQRIDSNKGIDFILLDTLFKYEGKSKNIEISTYQASKKAGNLAASFSKNNKIGIILGKNTEFLKGFENGYIDGAKEIKKDIEIQIQYIGTGDDVYHDPNKGALIAHNLFKNGVDIIFAVAGESGLGVIQESQKNPNTYVIGVDQDQSSIGPNTVIASVVKSLDKIIYDEISQYLNQNFNKQNYIFENYTTVIYNPKFEYLK